MRVHRLGALIAIGLLAACGGGDDESAGGTADSDSAAEPSDASAESVELDDVDDSDETGISSLEEIPEECRRILRDFLRQVEPIVSDVDWPNATTADLAELGTAIEGPSAETDAEMERAGCNDMKFEGGDDQGFAMSLQLARSEVPGAVPWLEFVRDVSEGFDAAAPASELSGDPADDPETCDEAMTAVRELMSAADSMMELPVDELLAASTNLQAIPAVCSVEEIDALFNDPDFQAWSEA